MDARARGAPAHDPARVAGPGRRQQATGAAALTLLFGIDPIVALTDNSDVERDQIPDVLAWTARALVEAALKDQRQH